jgi:glyoxylase-like metal-dependent hydrolase (beta-lactamase superfamily II)
MHELLPGLYQIAQVLGPRYLYQYLLVGRRRTLLIDVGCASSPDSTILPFLQTIGFDPAHIDIVAVSHPDVDHHGGLARMRELAPRALFACHRLDAPHIQSKQAILDERYGWYRRFGLDYTPDTLAWIEGELGPDTPVDLLLSGGEAFLLDDERPVHVLHLPGHSDGHLGFYDEANRAVIVLDAVLGAGLLDMAGTIISPPPYALIDPYLGACDTVAALPFEHLLTAHYPNMNQAEGRAFVQQTKDFVGRMHAATQQALREQQRPLRLPEIHAAVDRLVGPFSAFAVELAKPVYAHLTQLVAAGQATRSDTPDGPAWMIA